MGPFKMTPFEATVIEMYELQVRVGKRNGLLGLYNKKNPVSYKQSLKISALLNYFSPQRIYLKSIKNSFV